MGWWVSNVDNSLVNIMIIKYEIMYENEMLNTIGVRYFTDASTESIFLELSVPTLAERQVVISSNEPIDTFKSIEMKQTRIPVITIENNPSIGIAPENTIRVVKL